MIGLIGVCILIGLFVLKLNFKKKIKELKRNVTNAIGGEASDHSVLGNIKKIKKRIIMLNITMTVIAMGLIFTLVIVFITIFSYTSLMSSMSGNAIIQLFDTPAAEQAQAVAGWVWTKTVIPPPGSGSGSGLYPKDPKLKLRAELLEILVKSTTDAQASTGTQVDPAWILGSIYRETGDELYSNMNNSSIASLKTDLVIEDPACGKGSCAYINNGISHYYGGTVVNGVDKGDPAKQIINTSQSTYDSMGGDHAIGYIQFEIPYFYEHSTRLYGNATPVLSGSNDVAKVSTEAKIDANTGFIRPNPFYIPDAMYNGAFVMASDPVVSGSDYSNILASSDFQSLSAYNQNFIKFMYSSAAYGRGHVAGADDNMAKALITLAKSGKIKNLDDMVISETDKYWDSSNLSSDGEWQPFENEINSTYGLNIPVGSVSWYGVFAGCVGKVAYTELTADIAAAPKDGTAAGGGAGAAVGNWLDHPGSGAYGNASSVYYVPELGVRWYSQTADLTTVNGSTWGSLPFLSTNMADCGCGIYALANSISNLTNKDITPDIVYNLVCPGGAYMSYDLVNKACTQYGLKSYQLENVNTSAGMDTLIAELKAGKMAEIWISGSTSFPWRNTNSGSDNHFITLKGVTADGQLMMITSTGHNGTSAEDLMKITITPETLMPNLANTYAWVIGN